MTVDAVEQSTRRQQFAVAAGLALAVAAAWAWLAPMARDIYGAMDGPAAWMMQVQWDWPYAAAIFAMWAAMMLGMMLPSAAPAVLLHARLASGHSTANRFARNTAFACGYVLAWTGFSLAATALQWGLSATGLLSSTMEITAAVPCALLLLGAGMYQVTPLKRRCLSQCRSPLTWLRLHWKPGVAGALRMGLEHGLFCLGCCWGLMLLLFAGGVMSLPVMVGLTALVLAEKLAPAFMHVDRWSGVCLITAGLWLLLR